MKLKTLTFLFLMLMSFFTFGQEKKDLAVSISVGRGTNPLVLQLPHSKLMFRMEPWADFSVQKLRQM